MLLEDRLNALQWSKKYRADYKRYMKHVEQQGIKDTLATALGSPIPDINLSEEGRKLCLKYNLFYPFNPDDKNLNDMLNIFPAVISSKIPDTNCDVIKSGSKIAFMVEVDATRDDATINDDFLRLYHAMKEIASVSTKSGKDGYSLMVDPWKAYSFYQRYHTIAEATRRMYDTDKDDNSYGSYYRQVDRAIKKAQEILAQFEQGR